MTQAVLLTGPGGPLEVMEVQVGDPGPQELRVRIAAAGVCHSDLHVIERKAPDLIYPCVLGHEASGEVLEVGEGVGDFAPGDHVILCVVPQCGECAYCQSGYPTLCVEARNIRTGTVPAGGSRTTVDGRDVGQLSGLGAWAEEAIVSTMSAVKIDRSMPLMAAALLGCGVVTGFGAVANVARTKEHDSIAVIGCGGLGLNAIQAGRIAGAERIFAIDVQPGKLEMAAAMGATDVVNSVEVDPSEYVLDLTSGMGVHAAFDFVVTQHTVTQALALTRPGGVVVLTGLGEESYQITTSEIIRTGRQIRGNLMGMGSFREDYEQLIELYLGGALRLDELISRQFSLNEAASAVDALGAGDVARSVFTPGI